MKTTKRSTRPSPKKKQKLSPIKLFFMQSLRSWCDQPETRDERTARKREIAKVLKKDIQTLKNMYLYGQGSLDDWFKAMDYISALKQETIMELYDNYPYIEKKLKSLSSEELKIYKYVKDMTEAELILLNRLIETGLQINRSLKSKK